MKSLLLALLLLLPASAFAEHEHHSRHLDDFESSGTVLDENMDDDIQAEEELSEEEERAIRREREIQQDDKQNPVLPRDKYYRP